MTWLLLVTLDFRQVLDYPGPAGGRFLNPLFSITGEETGYLVRALHEKVLIHFSLNFNEALLNWSMVKENRKK